VIASRTRPPGSPPGRLAASRATGTSAGCDPHSLEHPDQVLGRHIAGRTGRERASSQSPDRGIEDAHTFAECGVGVGQSQAVGVVRVQREGSDCGKARHAGCEQGFDVLRVGASGGVAQADLRIRPRRHQPIEQRKRLGLRHASGERTVECGCDVEADCDAGGEGGYQTLVFLRRFQRMPADIVAVVGFGDREHENQPSRAGIDGIAAASLAWNEHLRLEPVEARAGCQHFARVAQLRHRGAADERADLDAAQAGVEQLLQQPDLGFGRDKGSNALISVTRSNLHDLDGTRRLHHKTPSARSDSISCGRKPSRSLRTSSV